ncbi:hypothetical protein ACXZ1K_12055 [Pedobacter sp. PWIIR3]
MKKLANVSPFLLLLLPVFILMAFSFTNTEVKQNNVSLQGTSSKVALIKTK